jgi:hypothetical protein
MAATSNVQRSRNARETHTRRNGKGAPWRTGVDQGKGITTLTMQIHDRNTTFAPVHGPAATRARLVRRVPACPRARCVHRVQLESVVRFHFQVGDIPARQIGRGGVRRRLRRPTRRRPRQQRAAGHRPAERSVRRQQSRSSGRRCRGRIMPCGHWWRSACRWQVAPSCIGRLQRALAGGARTQRGHGWRRRRQVAG